MDGQIFFDDYRQPNVVCRPGLSWVRQTMFVAVNSSLNPLPKSKRIAGERGKQSLGG